MTQLEPRDTEHWVKTYLQPRHPELVDEHRAAVQAYNAAARSGLLSESALALLTAQAAHRSSVLRDDSAEMIGRLADAFAPAREAIAEMLAARTVKTRMSAVMALLFHRISPLHAELLPQALGDRSHQIRAVAAQIINGRGLFELVPALERALAVECHEDTREFMATQLALATDGYIVERSDDGTKLWVTCRSGSGTSGASFQPGDDWDSRGQAWLARTLQPADTRIPRSFP